MVEVFDFQRVDMIEDSENAKSEETVVESLAVATVVYQNSRRARTGSIMDWSALMMRSSLSEMVYWVAIPAGITLAPGVMTTSSLKKGIIHLFPTSDVYVMRMAASLAGIFALALLPRLMSLFKSDNLVSSG